MSAGGDAPSGGASEAPAVAAWRRFCRRLEALGEELASDPFPGHAGDLTEGVAHLADQVSCWLGWALAHADTTAPFFHRSNDLFTQWGGPNQDNVYHHARIDPRRRYRIRGQMRSCERFALTLRVGFMHMPEWGTRKALSSPDLGIGPGDPFEICFGGDGSEPGWVEIPEDVTTLSLREFYVDWQPEEPAVFTIECLDPPESPPTRDDALLAEQLEHAWAQVEHSMRGWNDYLREHRAAATDNTFTMHGAVAKGLAAARYAFLFWDLAPDEALVIDTDVPDAPYWGLQLASLGWYEPIDPVHRITSLNHQQIAVDPDGRARIVLAHRDPGVANWLDTGAHRDGLLTYRWFWPRSDPAPQVRVVAFDALAALLPDDAARVSPEERRTTLRDRQAHLAWRFRT
ncbi:MAG: hypothetical protein AAF430_01030 [Myxococcota bacterium]